MSELCLCPRCHQPLPAQMRAGVYLPPIKVRIFDTIEAHPGITVEGIVANCYEHTDGSKAPVNRVRVHVCQINDMLAETDIRIKGERLGGSRENGGYRIVKVRGARS